MPVEMGPVEFDALVDRALDGIPDEIAALVRNVVVLVEDEPPADDPDLLGLYDGIALTERWGDPMMELPDRIFIFRNPLLDMCESEEELETRSGSPSSTRSPTTSASTTTACTTSATPDSQRPEPQRAGGAATPRSSRRRTPSPRRGPSPWVCTAKAEYVVKPPQKPVPSSASGVARRAPSPRAARAGTTRPR